MRIWIVLVACVVACKRPEKPAPPPAVHVRRLPPVIGERFTYHLDHELAFELVDGTATLAATEKTDAEAEEVVTAVRNGIAVERTIRFTRFIHQPLGADQPIADVVTGKTYRWTGTPGPELAEAERAALLAYARPDTGAPDLAAHLLTDRDFTRGVPWEIPADQPAPFARGLHAGASITLTDLDGPIARFAIMQVRVLQIRDHELRMTLHGSVAMNVGTARIEAIAVEGQLTEPSGPVRSAHMRTLQTFTYPQ